MRRTLFSSLTGLVLAGLVMFAGTPAKAAVVMIDDFADGVNLSTLGGPTSAVNDGPHAGVLGAFRDTNLTLDSGTAVQVYYSPVIPQTHMFVGFAASTGTYSSVYDGFNAVGLNVNLVTPTLNDRFQASILAVNGTADLTISVVDTANVASSVTKPLLDGFSGNLDFLFSDYASDLTSVQSITLTLATTSDATDIAMGPVRAVPEPASAALLGLGSLLMFRRSRRNRIA